MSCISHFSPFDNIIPCELMYNIMHHCRTKWWLPKPGVCSDGHGFRRGCTSECCACGDAGGHASPVDGVERSQEDCEQNA